MKVTTNISKTCDKSICVNEELKLNYEKVLRLRAIFSRQPFIDYRKKYKTVQQCKRAKNTEKVIYCDLVYHWALYTISLHYLLYHEEISKYPQKVILLQEYLDNQYT